MKLSIRPGGLRWLQLGVVLMVAVGLAVPAGRVWLAAHAAAAQTPEGWQRAIQLEPGNAEYWHDLGLFEQWDFERGDLNLAIRYYQKATEINPHSDFYWMDLASAYETLGKRSQARKSFERAQEAHPASSEVAWRFGSFLLRQGNFAAAHAQIHQALLTSPKLAPAAIAECWKAEADMPALLDQVLPTDGSYYKIALRYFVSEQQIEPALAVWDRLRGFRQRVEMDDAVPLVNLLIRLDRTERARTVWQQGLQASGWPQDPAGASLVFNGGFEHPLLNGGFDWQELPVPGMTVEFDTDVFRSGSRSLRLQFNGKAGNVDFQHLLEYVAVEPGRRYHFSAYLRAEGITTDTGLHFVLSDARTTVILQTVTPDVTGTEPWTLLQSDLTAGPQTHLLAIVLRRVPTWHLDNNFQGTAWVDDVSLTPLPEAAAGGSR